MTPCQCFDLAVTQCDLELGIQNSYVPKILIFLVNYDTMVDLCIYLAS